MSMKIPKGWRILRNHAPLRPTDKFKHRLCNGGTSPKWLLAENHLPARNWRQGNDTFLFIAIRRKVK